MIVFGIDVNTGIGCVYQLSGRNEQPASNFECPMCEKMDILTTEWTLFVGEGDDGNWGDYCVAKGEFVGRGYLDRYKGLKITRMLCNCKRIPYRDRHVFFPSEIIFKRVMSYIGYKDGVIK